MIAIRQTEEAKELMIQGAWIGFQMGAGGDRPFGQYLSELGLVEQAQPSHSSPPSQLTATEAIAKAEGILARARQET